MGFLTPWALLAAPLALLPILLEWRGRIRGEPLRFSSLYLLDRARQAPRRTLTRSRWTLLLRCLTLLLLVLAAARPVGPGRGAPELHFPTRAIVAVDVSASAGQRREGHSLWPALRAAADSVLAAASADDRVALAAVADGVIGWWEGGSEALRERLALLEPTARGSDWPVALAALAAREEDGTETYLLTDGSAGARPPERSGGARPRGRRALRVLAGEPPPNRALAAAEWTEEGTVALAGRAWGAGAPSVAEAGRRVGDSLLAPAPLVLDGTLSAATWAVADTATFALSGEDGLAADDVRRVAAPGGGAIAGPYRVARWTPGDEPPEPGPLFWEAALAASRRGARVERVRSLAELAARPPDLAILPLRAYRPDQARLLADAAAGGARLLFAPACPEPACAPPPGWLPSPGPEAPDLAWRLGPSDRQTTLLPAPAGGPPAAVPEALLARVPVRGALAPTGDPAPDWTWDLASGAPALWVRGAVAVWLVPLGPPVTRFATTPVFPLVAEAALAAWDPRWAAGGGAVRPGAPLPVPAAGARVVGPLHAGAAAREWGVTPGGAAPRPEAPGFYRIEPSGGEAGDVRGEGEGARFVVVDVDPAEGDLTPISPGEWEAAWGVRPVPASDWADGLFPRRRGADLWPWLLALALAGLAAEASLRHARRNK